MADALNKMLPPSTTVVLTSTATRGPQYLAAIAASLGAVAAGTALSWTSPVLPQLENPDAPLFLTQDEGSWVGSVLAIGALVSAIPAGMCAERFGRRLTILALAVPFLVNWALIVTASSVSLLYVARFFAGMATGSICVTAPMYIGEIAEAAIRGTLGSFFQMFLCAGILLTFVLGALLPYVQMSLALAIVPVVFAGVFYFMPESPVYLLGQGRKREAEDVVRWFRGEHYDVAPVIEAIEADILANAGKTVKVSDLVSSRGNRNALIASLGLMFFQQFSGINAVIFYTVPIFKSAGSSMDANVAAILVGVVQLALAYIATVVIDKAGRKFFLLLSGTLMAVCLAGLGYYFKKKEAEADVESIGWLPLVSLILFIVGFCLGFGPIPWMIMSELFASEVRGLASGVAVMVNWTLVFIVTKSFGGMINLLGSGDTFFIFMAFVILGAIFVFYKVPETRGKSLSEIQDILNGRKSERPRV